MSDADREVLTVKKKPRGDSLRREMAMRDFESLMLREDFLRTLFTIFSTAGMFNSNYQPDGRDLAFHEGRRSLGLDILASARAFGGPDALLRILEAEKKTQQGGSSGRRNTIDDDDIDGPDDADDGSVVAGSGLVFLDYDGKQG